MERGHGAVRSRRGLCGATQRAQHKGEERKGEGDALTGGAVVSGARRAHGSEAPGVLGWAWRVWAARGKSWGLLAREGKGRSAG